MKTLIERGSRLAFTLSRERSNYANAAAIGNRLLDQTFPAWTCRNCLAKSQVAHFGLQSASRSKLRNDRGFATSSRWLQEDKRSEGSSSTSINAHEDSHASTSTSTSAESKSLPSQTEQQRWQLSKRTAEIMDRLLARASLASQRINVYTGTDYSGIEALRQEIIALEKKVRGGHQEVEESRLRHREAHSKQAAAQKEIVGLLERKSSWTPSDLERYMSLVRSEHTDEQAVSQAKEDLALAERTLEDSRSLLERLERKQYHEEQIWSDTIRRNSTWVTFGLMGVNIVLLLAQIAIFEPYRRKKIVRDVQKALDEKTVHTPSASIQQAVDEVVEPVGVSVEQIEEPIAEIQPQQSDDAAVSDAEHESARAQAALTDIDLEPIPVKAETSQYAQPVRWWAEYWDTCRVRAEDLFSDRIIQITKAEATTLALEGAATGVVLMGLVFALFRPT